MMMMLLGPFFIGMALALLALGWRGKVVDQHPVCRACRFDLDGLFPDITVCPECGSQLGGAKPGGMKPGDAQSGDADKNIGTAGENGVRIGNRVRRRGLLGLGAVLFVVSVGIFVVNATTINWDRYKPMAVLSAELRYMVGRDDPARAEAIISEILGRVTADTLDPARLDALVDHALDVQADDDATWTTAWGDLIDAYDIEVGLDPERLAAYLRRGVVESATIRPRVRQGDNVPIQFSHGQTRLGAGRTVAVRRRVAGGSIAGRPLPTNRGMMGTTRSGTSGGSGSSRTAVRLGDPPVAPGHHLLALELAYTLSGSWEDDGPALATWTTAVLLPLEVVPRTEEDIVLLVPGDPLDPPAALRGTITVRRLAVGPGFGSGLGFSATLQLEGVMEPCAFDVFLVGGEGGEGGVGGEGGGGENGGGDGQWAWEILLSAITYEPPLDSSGAHSSGHGVFGEVPEGFDAKTVTVLLRPSREAARSTISLTEIWGREIVIENVPVTWPKAGGN